ncbi:MAG TPA: hypothetical protein DDW84_05855, partial [Phycisphaerales bacterium]|nr:hypothetical protein [Phycisphaerales bacterium]
FSVNGYGLVTRTTHNCGLVNECIYKLTTWWWICNFQIGDMVTMYLRKLKNANMVALPPKLSFELWS